MYLSGASDTDRPGGRQHVAARSGSGAASGGEILRTARTREAARKIPESGGGDRPERGRTRRNLDDGGEVRGVWFLQGARRDGCGHLVPHGVSENAAPGGGA